MTLISAIVLLTNNELLQLKCYNSTMNKVQQLIMIYKIYKYKNAIP